LQEAAKIFQAFSQTIIDAVAELVPVIKPQVAFFEQLGSAGMVALENVIAAARDRGLLVLLDAKRGDVPNTAAAYARAYLASSPPRPFECDAITVNPYLGLDGLEPFFEAAAAGKGVFVCVKTSNPGSRDIQELRVDDQPLYLEVARLLRPAILMALLRALEHTPTGPRGVLAREAELRADELTRDTVAGPGVVEDAAAQRIALGAVDLVAAAGVHARPRGGKLAVREGDGERFHLCVEQALDRLLERERGLEAE
jgi:orotidine-5'-phosphate decarboxylase